MVSLGDVIKRSAATLFAQASTSPRLGCTTRSSQGRAAANAMRAFRVADERFARGEPNEARVYRADGWYCMTRATAQRTGLRAPHRKAHGADSQ